MHYALYLIGRRYYSEKELRDKLKRRTENLEELEKIIARLKEMKLLDDLKYASAYVRSELSRAPQGFKSIKYRLLKKGFKPHDIEITLAGSQIDEVQLAREALSKKAKSLKKTDNTKYTQKLYRFLLSRGFTPGASINAIENHTGQEKLI